MSGGYTKRDIIDAVIEALKPLSVKGGGYVRQLEARGLDEGPYDVLDRALRLPAIFVSFSSSGYSPGQYMYVRETVGFEVTVVMTGGPGRGPEEVLDDIRGALCGSTLGLGIGPVMVVRESPLAAGGHRVAFSALYSVTQSVPVQNT